DPVVSASRRRNTALEGANALSQSSKRGHPTRGCTPLLASRSPSPHFLGLDPFGLARARSHFADTA
ncbi:MAG: hypothetical protein AAFX99_15260, partial [Myxococcota bacterium]